MDNPEYEDWNYEVWNKKKKRIKRRENSKKTEGYKKKMIGLEKELKYISGREDCYKALSSGKRLYWQRNLHKSGWQIWKPSL